MIANCVTALLCSLAGVTPTQPTAAEQNVWLPLGGSVWKMVLAETTLYITVLPTSINFVLHVDCSDVPDRQRKSAIFSWSGGAEFSAAGVTCQNQLARANVTFHLDPGVISNYPTEVRRVISRLRSQRSTPE